MGRRQAEIAASLGERGGKILIPPENPTSKGKAEARPDLSAGRQSAIYDDPKRGTVVPTILWPVKSCDGQPRSQELRIIDGVAD